MWGRRVLLCSERLRAGHNIYIGSHFIDICCVQSSDFTSYPFWKMVTVTPFSIDFVVCQLFVFRVVPPLKIRSTTAPCFLAEIPHDIHSLSDYPSFPSHLLSQPRVLSDRIGFIGSQLERQEFMISFYLLTLVRLGIRCSDLLHSDAILLIFLFGYPPRLALALITSRNSPVIYSHNSSILAVDPA